jgi:flagellar protein FlaI
MRDPNIEDISCDGVRKPVYVWHRKYENMRTNLIFQSEEELDNLIIKLVHMAGKHISSAFPIVDAILPDKHRLSACFRREVTPFGSTFTIRKFRTDPFTAVDFINMNTFDASLAAYLWLCMENRLSVIILGGTAAGKTSLLNVLVSLIKPGTKIITIEETPELNLPQENWVSLTSRESYGLGAEKIGEVTLFDLVKASLRHRPDILIVGEVRGEEAYVLFQALATGHGGMCTMHAEDLTSAIKRLTAPPMNVAPVYIPLMNLILTIRRVKGVARRVVECHEIVDYGDYVLTSKWQPEKDAFKYNFNESVMLKRISDARGWTLRQTLSELRHREKILLWMAKEGIRDLKSVANMVTEYYRRPKAVYKRLSRV